MDDQQRDELRERNRRRAYRCTQCGGPTTEIDGAQLSSDGHFPGVTYKVCGGCGFEAVKKIRPLRDGRGKLWGSKPEDNDIGF